MFASTTFPSPFFFLLFLLYIIYTLVTLTATFTLFPKGIDFRPNRTVQSIFFFFTKTRFPQSVAPCLKDQILVNRKTCFRACLRQRTMRRSPHLVDSQFRKMRQVTKPKQQIYAFLEMVVFACISYTSCKARKKKRNLSGLS